uniref:Vascular cell adhesion protein 1-like n=1 Tax=Seriola dumerili TaxID=41447 RepID=A0A3B4ULV5_SERDU
MHTKLKESLVCISAYCAEKPEFTPSRLVVKYGDATSARCSVCESCSKETFDLERALGDHTTNGTTIVWKVKNMTEWDTTTTCYFTNATDHQCCTVLPITVYKPPNRVSISFLNHTGPMFMGHDYTLQCEVQKVAPVEKLSVTFYRGQTALAQLQSNNKQKKPVTEIFSLSITPRKEDNGLQYWCEAKLELGPEGPELPPLVTSQRATATVFCESDNKANTPQHFWKWEIMFMLTYQYYALFFCSGEHAVLLFLMILFWVYYYKELHSLI